jgi:cell wall-associated NlpC family hydrolase
MFYVLIAMVYIINSAMTYNREHNADKLAAYYGHTIENEQAKELLKIANDQLGKPYRYGSKGPNAFDCSGLTRYVFNQVDIPLGASSRDQALQGESVDIDEVIPGDLVFFRAADVSSSVIDHVGIVVSSDDTNIQFIHSTGQGVMIDDLLTSDYYREIYVSARRVLD